MALQRGAGQCVNKWHATRGGQACHIDCRWAGQIANTVGLGDVLLCIAPGLVPACLMAADRRILVLGALTSCCSFIGPTLESIAPALPQHVAGDNEAEEPRVEGQPEVL